MILYYMSGRYDAYALSLSSLAGDSKITEAVDVPDTLVTIGMSKKCTTEDWIISLVARLNLPPANGLLLVSFLKILNHIIERHFFFR